MEGTVITIAGHGAQGLVPAALVAAETILEGLHGLGDQQNTSPKLKEHSLHLIIYRILGVSESGECHFQRPSLQSPRKLWLPD